MKIDLKAQITQCVTLHDALNHQFDQLNALFGACSDSPFGDAVWNIVQNHITLLDEIAGPGQWVQWFIWENDCGRAQHTARIGDHVRSINNIDDLMWAINTSGKSPSPSHEQSQ